jgi:FkbM family methyltransferase
MTLPTGATILLPINSHSASEVFVTNANIDWGAEALFLRFADKTADFLDIGAHIGYYSAYLSPRVRQVFAFEPDPRNFPGLRANAQLAGNMEIIEMAVSSRNGSSALFVGQESSVSSLNGVKGEKSIPVKTITIDSFVTQHPNIRIGLIKIDIEGYDLEALRGMQETIARDQPLILTECEQSRELFELCKQWNYEIYGYAVPRRGMKYVLEHIRADAPEKLVTKMLFLVPLRLRMSFEGIHRPIIERPVTPS